MWKDLVVAKELFYKFTTIGFLNLILDKSDPTNTSSLPMCERVSVWKSAKP